MADFISGNSFLRTMVRELLVDPVVWVIGAAGDV
jgi:tRNA U38,U39,U40 pseudouridine synthase TruA